MKRTLSIILAILFCTTLAHSADPKAKRVRVTDAAGYYTSDNVEGVLQEVGASVIVGAPINGTYITQTANATLTNEQALTGLSDGMLKVDGTTGILSNATADTDYLTPGTAASTYEPVRGPDDNYVTDAEKIVIGNTSGANTGDETTATIKTKLGAAATAADGYLTSTDWNTFNDKQDGLTAGVDYLTPTGDGSGLSGVVTAETDPVVAAINGIVKSNGTTIAVAIADTDYDSSITNEINTITTPDAEVTEGLGITFADTGIMTITEIADTITFDATEVDGSTTNEINTATGDDTNSTTGLDITIAGGGINATTVAGNTVTITGTEVDGSTSNEINTITADDTNSTSGLGITLAGAGIVATTASGNTVTITATGWMEV